MFKLFIHFLQNLVFFSFFIISFIFFLIKCFHVEGFLAGVMNKSKLYGFLFSVIFYRCTPFPLFFCSMGSHEHLPAFSSGPKNLTLFIHQNLCGMKDMGRNH